MSILLWAYVVGGLFMGVLTCVVPVEHKFRHASGATVTAVMALNFGSLCVSVATMREGWWQAPVGAFQAYKDTVLHWTVAFRMVLTPLFSALACAIAVWGVQKFLPRKTTI